MTDQHPLKCLQFKPKDEHIKKQPEVKYHSLLPKHPFSWALVGSSRSGKTTFLFNALFRFYSGYFEKIYIVTPSWYTDDTYTIMHGKIPEDQVCTEFNEITGFVDRILEEQKDDWNNKHRKCLIVFDDWGALTSKIDSLNHLARIRHSNCSTFVVTQKLLVWLRPAVRANLSHISLFGSGSAYERKSIAREYSWRISEAEFLDMWEMACTKVGDQLYINLRGGEDTHYAKNIYIPITVSR